ncbi:MAG: squalene--hopene cyclase [Wenzhouxiangellaceae bacterium]|nr:squalene--hopene cyclase [Wenzhouxiangellaceae bacterium]
MTAMQSGAALKMAGQESILDAAIRRGIDRLLADQREDGHWVYELEADCTIPAEYICYLHYMDRRRPDLEARIARFLLSRQQDDGSWPLFFGGPGDLSCTVKAYFALKLAGHSADDPALVRARQWILAQGGAERTNVFTRILLAWFGQVPWQAVPYMPVEIMLLPRWFVFSLDKVSYWSRTVMVPLFIVNTLRVKAANPSATTIAELFVTPPTEVRDWFHGRSWLNRAFLGAEWIGRRTEWAIPGALRRRAMKQAEAWFVERLNGLDGLGAIFPAMVNASIALKELGYPDDHPLRIQTREAIDRLLVENADGSVYCQPCVSPVWDTGLAALALDATGEPDAIAAAGRGLDWLAERQLTDQPGDWQRDRPDLPGGGWPFQYANAHYPDLDDTAMVAWGMQAHDAERYQKAVLRAGDWLTGMQSSNGGFAAFDIDNSAEYLNEIPFADHGALLDPPTADVSGRVLRLFAETDEPQHIAARERVRSYLLAEQEADGSWWGRWGTNYIYGTWSVVVALAVDGHPDSHAAIARAADWLQSMQREDGGWGEGNFTYHDPSEAGTGSCSRAFQTAWALLALIAAGRAGSDAVRRGVDWLCRNQAESGDWPDPWFTAPGFPRVFYLKYHGYSRYFPLWALAEARRAWRERA